MTKEEIEIPKVGDKMYMTTYYGSRPIEVVVTESNEHTFKIAWVGNSQMIWEFKSKIAKGDCYQQPWDMFGTKPDDSTCYPDHKLPELKEDFRVVVENKRQDRLRQKEEQKESERRHIERRERIKQHFGGMEGLIGSYTLFTVEFGVGQFFVIRIPSCPEFDYLKRDSLPEQLLLVRFDSSDDCHSAFKFWAAVVDSSEGPFKFEIPDEYHGDVGTDCFSIEDGLWAAIDQCLSRI